MRTLSAHCVAAARAAASAVSPFLALVPFFGKRTSLALYSVRRATLAASDSALLFVRRLSTEMPMVLARGTGIFAALSSARLKPRPRRTLAQCFCVGQWTTGRRRATGRGATAAALAARFCRRICFFAGWSNQVMTLSGPRDELAHFLWKCWLGTSLLCLTMVYLIGEAGQAARSFQGCASRRSRPGLGGGERLRGRRRAQGASGASGVRRLRPCSQ
mmetsp:Transcript_23450/g.80612  ORF Transcript_23450/g.80612 Transcript_23450/m.80612 type:complete len:217 (+) Transcript_23450:237-887(+)